MNWTVEGLFAGIALGDGPRGVLVVFHELSVEELGEGDLDSGLGIAVILIEEFKFDQGIESFLAGEDGKGSEAEFTAFSEALRSGG